MNKIQQAVEFLILVLLNCGWQDGEAILLALGVLPEQLGGVDFVVEDGLGGGAEELILWALLEPLGFFVDLFEFGLFVGFWFGVGFIDDGFECALLLEDYLW